MTLIIKQKFKAKRYFNIKRREYTIEPKHYISNIDIN